MTSPQINGQVAHIFLVLTAFCTQFQIVTNTCTEEWYERTLFRKKIKCPIAQKLLWKFSPVSPVHAMIRKSSVFQVWNSSTNLVLKIERTMMIHVVLENLKCTYIYLTDAEQNISVCRRSLKKSSSDDQLLTVNILGYQLVISRKSPFCARNVNLLLRHDRYSVCMLRNSKSRFYLKEYIVSCLLWLNACT